MRDQKLYELLLKTLQKKKKAVLLIVVNASGSTPGKQGFKLLLTEEGEQKGTIGGGIMELKLLAKIREEFNQEKLSFKYLEQIHRKNAEEEKKSGLICSGSQEIIYGCIIPNKNTIEVIQTILESYEKNFLKIMEIRPTELAIKENNNQIDDYSFKKYPSSDWSYEERLDKINRVYIFGGGHVGSAVAKVMHNLDFYTTIIDNRKNLKMFEEIIAQKKLIMPYNEVNNLLIEGKRTYLVVVTTSMINDIEVLENVLNLNVRYIGLMGSKTKIKEIFTQLKSKGITNGLLDKIKTPIGIQINSETPEEIAISIASEIIQLKNSRTNP